MQYFAPVPRRRSVPSVRRLSEAERRAERDAMIKAWLEPYAGVAHRRERPAPPGEAVSQPAPRSTITPMPCLSREPRLEPIAIAIAGSLGGLAIVVVALLVYASAILLRGAL